MIQDIDQCVRLWYLHQMHVQTPSVMNPAVKFTKFKTKLIAP